MLKKIKPITCLYISFIISFLIDDINTKYIISLDYDNTADYLDYTLLSSYIQSSGLKNTTYSVNPDQYTPVVDKAEIDAGDTANVSLLYEPISVQINSLQITKND